MAVYETNTICIWPNVNTLQHIQYSIGQTESQKIIGMQDLDVSAIAVIVIPQIVEVCLCIFIFGNVYANHYIYKFQIQTVFHTIYKFFEVL